MICTNRVRSKHDSLGEWTRLGTASTGGPARPCHPGAVHLGLRIQGDAARSEPAVAEQINGYAKTLDEVIATIRTSIAGLHLRFNLF
jgi:hypothetical protein